MQREEIMAIFKCTYVSKGKNPRVLHCEAKDSEQARKIAARDFSIAADEPRLDVVEAPTETLKKPDDEPQVKPGQN
jgi:hypothetical protein